MNAIIYFQYITLLYRCKSNLFISALVTSMYQKYILFSRHFYSLGDLIMVDVVAIIDRKLQLDELKKKEKIYRINRQTKRLRSMMNHKNMISNSSSTSKF